MPLELSKSDKRRIANLTAAARALQDGHATYFSITKLTSLKGLCQQPETANQFVFHLARRAQTELAASSRSDWVGPADWERYQALAVEAITAMGNYLQNDTPENLSVLQTLRNSVRDLQSTHSRSGWDTVRTIYSNEVLLIEYALECMISPQFAPDYAYRAGRTYAERYEPSYGTGLVPASAPMLENIVEFWHRYYDF